MNCLKVPPFLLKRLYVKGSLQKTEEGFSFKLKNVLAKATIVEPIKLRVDGEEIDQSSIEVLVGGAKVDIGGGSPFTFDVGTEVEIKVKGVSLEEGEHTIEITTKSKEFGELKFDIKDSLK